MRWLRRTAMLLFAVLVIGITWLAIRAPAQRPDIAPTAAPPARVAISPTTEQPSPKALLVPVAGIGRDQLVDTFGAPRGGGTRGHGALDIAAPRGTPVIAAASGTVEKIFESVPGGHTVYVRSTDGQLIYYYAHLDSYALGLGEGLPVRAGQELGTVGSTGNADPAAPHLHFEIKRMAPGERWYQGTAVNPYDLLVRPGAVH